MLGTSLIDVFTLTRNENSVRDKVTSLRENLRVDYLNVLTAVSDPTKEIARMSGCSQMNLTATEKPNSEMSND